MRCPGCGADNSETSKFCRYCATPISAQSSSTSGYMPSVPPPGAEAYREPPQATYEPAPEPPARRVVGQRLCPRCTSPTILKGSTPAWAVVMAVVLFPIFCFFSLFFLLIKEPSTCLQCGFRFK
jgi:hypothetical protein